MCSRVRAKWLIGCVLTCVGLFGCQVEPARPAFVAPELCNAQGLRVCICAGGQATGWIPCTADRMLTECGGCQPPMQVGAAGSAAIASGVNAAGSAAPAVGVPGSGVQGGAASAPASGGAASAPGSAPPAAVGGCSVGETCRQTALGSMKFCTADPAATYPPVCTAAGQVCGSNGKGVCSSGAPAGVPTALYCVVPSC